jgi:hypothetical protein
MSGTGTQRSSSSRLNTGDSLDIEAIRRRAEDKLRALGGTPSTIYSNTSNTAASASAAAAAADSDGNKVRSKLTLKATV